MERAFEQLLIATAVLSLLFAMFAVARKLQRDRNEVRFRRRREHFRSLILAGDTEPFASELRRIRRSQLAQVDLAIVLQGTRAELSSAQEDAVRHSVERASLERRLIRQLHARDPVRRATAILLISQLRLHDARELLEPFVQDRDGDVRLVAIRAIAEFADESAARTLVHALEGHVVAPERLVERFGAPWAVPTVTRALEDSTEVGTPVAENGQRSLRSWLARALGLARDPRAEPALRELLGAGDVEEQVSAARALGTAGTRHAFPDLEAALASPHWQVRAQAARALGQLGVVDAVPTLAALLADPGWWVRGAAADALRQLGAPGLEALRAALHHQDRYARDRAREALALEGVKEGTRS
jgi:HEAT repeat protein